MLVLGIVATKGGVGKTTIAANLGGLLTDIGYSVLLIDADIQPSLSGFFSLRHEAEQGLSEMVMSGTLTPDSISQIELPPESFTRNRASLNVNGGRLDIVRSDTRDGRLQDWLSTRLDRLVRISMALRGASSDTPHYDVVIIDTQGAVGHLQDAAVNAADVLITPVAPSILSAREFVAGTLQLLERHESAVNMGYKVPAMKAVINCFQRTVDSRATADLIRAQFMAMRGRLSVLRTTIPNVVAYRNAATAQVPVHWVDPNKAGDTMHTLLWELIPSMEGQFAPNHRGAIPDGFVTSEAADETEGSTSADTRR